MRSKKQHNSIISRPLRRTVVYPLFGTHVALVVPAPLESNAMIVSRRQTLPMLQYPSFRFVGQSEHSCSILTRGKRFLASTSWRKTEEYGELLVWNADYLLISLDSHHPLCHSLYHICTIKPSFEWFACYHCPGPQLYLTVLTPPPRSNDARFHSFAALHLASTHPLQHSSAGSQSAQDRSVRQEVARCTTYDSVCRNKSQSSL